MLCCAVPGCVLKFGLLSRYDCLIRPNGPNLLTPPVCRFNGLPDQRRVARMRGGAALRRHRSMAALGGREAVHAQTRRQHQRGTHGRTHQHSAESFPGRGVRHQPAGGRAHWSDSTADSARMQPRLLRQSPPPLNHSHLLSPLCLRLSLPAIWGGLFAAVFGGSEFCAPMCFVAPCQDECSSLDCCRAVIA